MSNCKVIISHMEEVDGEQKLVHSLLLLDEAFDPSTAVSVKDLIKHIDINDDTVELLNNLSSTVSLSESESSQLSESVLDEWNKSLKKDIAKGKDVQLIGSDELNNYVSRIGENSEIYLKILDEVDPNWRTRKVVILNKQTKIPGSKPYIYYNDGNQELEVLKESYIKSYILYKLLLKEYELQDSIDIKADIDYYLNNNKKDNDNKKFFEILEEISLAKDPVKLFFRYLVFNKLFETFLRKNSISDIITFKFKVLLDRELINVQVDPYVFKFNSLLNLSIITLNDCNELIAEINANENTQLATPEDLILYVNHNTILNGVFYSIKDIIDDKVIVAYNLYREGNDKKYFNLSAPNFNLLNTLPADYDGDGLIPVGDYKGYAIYGMFDGSGNIRYYCSNLKLIQTFGDTKVTGVISSRHLDYIKNKIDEDLSELRFTLSYDVVLMTLNLNKVKVKVRPETKDTIGRVYRVLDVSFEDNIPNENINALLKTLDPESNGKLISGILASENPIWKYIKSEYPEFFNRIGTALHWRALFLKVAELLNKGLKIDGSNISNFSKEIKEITELIENAEYKFYKLSEIEIEEVKKEQRQRRTRNVAKTNASKNIRYFIFTKEELLSKQVPRNPINMTYYMSQLVKHLLEHFNIKVLLITNDQLKNDEAFENIRSGILKNNEKAFIYNSTIYVIVNRASASDMLHEFAHLILGYIKVQNPKLYAELVSKIADIKLGDIQIKKEIGNDPRPLLDLMEEELVKSFSNFISSKLSAGGLLSTILKLFKRSVEKVFNLKSSTLNSDLSNITLEELFNLFGSFMLDDSSNPEVSKLLCGESVTTQRKVTNAISELIKLGIIRENLQKDSNGKYIDATYTLMKRVDTENEDGTVKHEYVASDQHYTIDELRELVRNHIIAINEELAKLKEANKNAGKKKKKEKNITIDMSSDLDTDFGKSVGSDIKTVNKILSNVTDIIFSRDEDPEITDLIIKLHSYRTHKIGTVASEINEIKEQGEVSGNRDYISLYSYLDEAKTSSGTQFIEPFNLNEYKEIETSILQNKGNDVKQIEAILDSKVKGFTDMMRNAYNIHKAAKIFFSANNGVLPFYDFFNVVKDNFNQDRDIVEKLYSLFKIIRESIKNLVGGDVEFIPNILLTSKIVGESRKLVANVDLIAIDKNNPDKTMYVFKFLTANDLYDGSRYQEFKEERSDYNLGFIRHMLASKGFPAENIKLYTVDISVALNVDGLLENIVFDKLNDRLAPLNVGNAFNRLYWRNGSFFKNINEKIPIQLADSGGSGKYKDDIIKSLLFAFPGVIARLSDTDLEVQEFIRTKHRILDSTDPNSRYMFIDYTVSKKDPDRYIHIKETSDPTVNKELLQKVKEYLKRERLASKIRHDEFVDKIQKAINGNISIREALASFNTVQLHFLEVLFRKYLGGRWKFHKNDALADLGIYLIQNPETGLVDIINFSNFNGKLNEGLELSLGRTILGEFEEDYKSMTRFENILRASKGNIEQMKVMFVLNLPEVAAIFNGTFKIGDIKTINMITALGTTTGIATLNRSFVELKKLMLKNGFLLPDGLGNAQFMSPFELFKQNVYALTKLDFAQDLRVDTIYAALERVNPMSLAETKKELLKIEEMMRNNENWKILLLPVDELAKNMETTDNPVVHLYILLWKCIYFCDGDFLLMDKIHKYSGTFKDRDFLNGTMTNNPGSAPDKNLRRATKLSRSAMNRITMRLTHWYGGFRENELAKFHKAKNFGALLNGVFGALHYMYKNMLRTNSDGTLNNLMLLKDPDDNTNNLRPEEREFLRYFLWEINEMRFNLVSKNDPKIPELKASGEWFWLPLVQADDSSKIQLGHITTRLKRSVKEFSKKLEAFKQSGSEDEIVFTEEEYKMYKEGIENYKMFDLFSYSESSIEHRLLLISEIEDLTFWELNLETVLVRYKFSKIRQQEFNRVLPMIKGLRLLAQVQFLEQENLESTEEKTSLKNFDEFLLNHMNVAIYNKSIMNDEARYFAKMASLVKFFAATVALGFNFVGGIRECLEGAWKTIGRSVSGFYQTDDHFDKKDWLKAMGLILIDSPDFVLRVTLLEAICLRFRIANMDINALADRIKSNKAGLMNAKDRLLFWFLTSPDYFTRMSLLLAKMIHDGVFEALGYDLTGLTYDWKKDKRFSHYANPNAVHDALWHNERGLYLSLLLLALEDYSDIIGQLKEGDDLPMPYTDMEIQSIKDLSDITFGSYDHDVRMMLEKLFAGALLMLFKTYLSATKTTYFLKPDTYNVGERKLLYDEKTGKPLFVHTDENGHVHVNTEDNGEPYTANTNSYMLGLYWSLEDAWKVFRTKGIEGLKARYKDDKRMQSNLKQFGYNLFIWLMLGALISYLIKLWANHRKEESVGEDITFNKIVRDEAFNVLSRSVVGSFTDFNIINSFIGNIMDSEPASIGIINNLFTSTGEMLFGNRSLKYWFRTNSGLYRSLSGIGDNIYELIKTQQAE